MVFLAAVIGLGNIGMGYDYEDASGRLAITHSSGFSQHAGFELSAGVDPSPERRAQFERKYDRPAFPSVSDLLDQHRCDVFSIGVPAARQSEVFRQLLLTGPSAVICEKPLAQSVDAGRGMVDAASAAGCDLLVNYVRRFDPGVNRLRDALRAGELGRVYKGVAWYTKGLRNNGSHYIDLLRFLLGEVTAVRVISRGRLWGGTDPEPDLLLAFGDCEVTLLAAREENFSFGHIDLISDRGVISYKDSGLTIEIRTVCDDSIYDGYTVLDTAPPAVIKSELERYQWHVLDHLHAHLSNGVPLVSDGQNAVQNIEVIETAILKRSREADE